MFSSTQKAREDKEKKKKAEEKKRQKLAALKEHENEDEDVLMDLPGVETKQEDQVLHYLPQLM